MTTQILEPTHLSINSVPQVSWEVMREYHDILIYGPKGSSCDAILSVQSQVRISGKYTPNKSYLPSKYLWPTRRTAQSKRMPLELPPRDDSIQASWRTRLMYFSDPVPYFLIRTSVSSVVLFDMG